jgi:hypothetical protein
LISAEQFAKSRSSYWGELLPRLDRFIRAVNIEGARFSPPINSVVEAERHAFVAELAFELLRLEIEGDRRPTPSRSEEATETVRRRLATVAGIEIDSVGEPGRAELEEVDRLRRALRKFLADRNPNRIAVSPTIAGCGVIDACAADLLLWRKPTPFDILLADIERASLRLLEVKIVERGFRAADFRQLITYAALMSAEGDAPDAVGLVNPRRGTFFECTVAELAMDTAGLSADELLQQIVFDISTSEVSL